METILKKENRKMEKLKSFAKKHKKELYFIGSGLTIAAAILIGSKAKTKFGGNPNTSQTHLDTMEEVVELLTNLDMGADWMAFTSKKGGYEVLY